jgi:hypothetical protein
MKVALKIILLFFLFNNAKAQNGTLTLLKGKVIGQLKDINEIYVLNLRSESSTNTDTNGNFSLFVKVGDTVQFSGLQIVSKKVVLYENDLAKQLYVVVLETKINQLEEVKIIKYENINAVSLGILQRPAKVFTPAERKLSAAGEFHWYSPLLIPLGGMSVDGLINSISGRTAMLKKELEIERKESLLLKIENQFQYSFFTEVLKIPVEYVRGFWYYSVEDPKLVSALKAKNNNMSKFIFGELAPKYLQTIIKNE